MSKRETWEKLRTMTAVERLRVALKADEIQVTNFGSSGDWDCQGDVEELLEENERLRAEVQASIRMNKLLVNENKRLKEREAYCTDPHCLVCDQTRYFVRPHERLREGDK